MKSNLRTEGFKTCIAPWVLPREDIPINIELPQDLDFDKIHIKIPDDFEFVDFFNVENVTVYEDNAAIIDGIIKAKLQNTPLYFGFVVSSKEIPENLKTSRKIFVEIISGPNIIKKIELKARIFRPKLEITDIVESIELTDDEDEYKVPMNLKYIGFGDIQIKIQGEIQGKIVSQGESIIDELLRRIYSEVQQNTKPEINENKDNLQFDSETIKRITGEIEKKVIYGDIREIIDDSDSESFEQYFKDAKTKNEFLKIVYTRLEDILFNMLTEILDRHPTDNVMLTNSKTNITTKIDSMIENITTKVLYKDKLDNIYPPVEIPIKIIDHRKGSKKTIIKMPMIIKKWEEEPFMNVAEMNIEGDD